MVEEKERMNKQVVEDLVKMVDQKNDMVVVLRNMVDEVDSMRVKAEEGKRKMEEQHKRDLEAMQLQVQAKEATHNERMSAHQMALTKKLRALEGLREAVKEAEQDHWCGRLRRCYERSGSRRRCMHLCSMSSRTSKRGSSKSTRMGSRRWRWPFRIRRKRKLIERQKLELIERQELELQKQHVQGILDIEKSNETDKDRIAELKSEQEGLQDMVNVLSQNERTANNLLEDVGKVAIQVLNTYGVNGRIGNKLIGLIDEGPWAVACRNKFQYFPDGWVLVMSQKISEWKNRIGDPGYHPFKMLRLDPQGNEWKRDIDEDNVFLKRLKEDLGAEVLQIVETALLEIQEYEADWRDPMWVPWNFEKNARVESKDLLLFLKESLDDARRKLAKTYTKRARVSQY